MAEAEDLIVVPQGRLYVMKLASHYSLIEHGQRFVVAHGGRGGRGNIRFAAPKNRSGNF